MAGIADALGELSAAGQRAGARLSDLARDSQHRVKIDELGHRDRFPYLPLHLQGDSASGVCPRYYVAVKQLMIKENARAICSAACMGEPRACLTFSKLNDLGLVGACEGDIDSTLTQTPGVAHVRDGRSMDKWLPPPTHPNFESPVGNSPSFNRVLGLAKRQFPTNCGAADTSAECTRIRRGSID